MKIKITSSPYECSGISIDYIKKRRELYISGWYDSMVGIQGDSFTLKEFFEKLGITKKDCEEAFKS